MTQTELRELLYVWQERLRLRDWKIRLKFQDLENDYGSCYCNIEDKTATIKILNLKDKLWGDNREVTPEKVLVHEILHIHFWLLHDGDVNHHNMSKVEQAINFITDALVNARS